MNDNGMKNRPEDKIVYALCVILGLYCAYLYVTNLKACEGNRDKDAVPHTSMPDHLPFPAPENKEYDAEASDRVYKALSGGTSEADVFNDNLDEYLEDPEDEITFPSEIYDTQIDDEEEDLMTGDIHY